MYSRSLCCALESGLGLWRGAPPKTKAAQITAINAVEKGIAARRMADFPEDSTLPHLRGGGARAGENCRWRAQRLTI
jgi:hypothetical protein